MIMSQDYRQYAPATERNREFIVAILERVLPATGIVLEIASGTGEHAVFLAPRLRPRLWLPSEPNPQLRASIAAWRSHLPVDNLYLPIDLNAGAPVWPVETEELKTEELKTEELKTEELRQIFSDAGTAAPAITAIVNINMIHISPWAACLGLMAGAGRILPPGGILYLYGPFQQGAQTAPSNLAFDRSLRAQDPAWGVRQLEDVVAAAKAQGLELVEAVAMPANNLSVVFQHS
ncbi:MAG: DUF938 domain-containing protein [Cyanothece sp. SIO1E1]|nr:DUF938 domain-containing protein [Cyanothece sp. SIO1E1]